MASSDMVELNPEEWALVHDLASLVHVSDLSLDCWYTLQAAVLPHTDLYSTGVPGHKVSVHEARTLICPFLLERTEGSNMVVLAFKHRGDMHYYYGVFVEKLAAWKEKAGGVVEEESLLSTVKTSSSSVKFATVLENTETVKLKDIATAILSGMSMFKSTSLTNPDKIVKWVQKTSFSTVVSKVLLEAEMRERKLAAEKGRAANDKEREVNRGLAAVAQKGWADIKKKIMLNVDFYSDSFSARFFIFEGPEALEPCLKDLTKHPLQDWLVPALKGHAEALKAGRVQPAAPATPLKKLLEPPPPKPESFGVAAAAVTHGDDEGAGGGEDVGDVGLNPNTEVDPEAAADADADTDADAAIASPPNVNPAEATAAASSADTSSAASSAAASSTVRQRRRAIAPEAAPAAAKAAPPPKPKPKATPANAGAAKAKRERPDGVPLPNKGRQKLMPDPGACPHSNADPDPDPVTLTLTLTPTLIRTQAMGPPCSSPTGCSPRSSRSPPPTPSCRARSTRRRVSSPRPRRRARLPPPSCRPSCRRRRCSSPSSRCRSSTPACSTRPSSRAWACAWVPPWPRRPPRPPPPPRHRPGLAWGLASTWLVWIKPLACGSVPRVPFGERPFPVEKGAVPH